MTRSNASQLDPAPERGSVAICVPVAASGEPALATIRAVLEHSDAAVPILLAGPAEALAALLEEPLLQPREGRSLLATAEEGGQSAALNRAVRDCHPADVALAMPGCVVTAGWLERLAAAAGSDSIVASATPLSIGGGGVEVLDTGPGDTAARAERAAHDGPALHPRIAAIGPGCAHIRRPALELVDPLQESLPLELALARMARAMSALGLVHVAADDALVLGPPSGAARHGEPAGGGDPLERTLSGDESLPLRRSLDRIRIALRGLSVTIDGRSLTESVGGTQTYALELILALAREPRLSVRVLVAHDLSARAAEALASAPGVELLSYEQAAAGAAPSDVVHRPQQVFTPDDLALLRLVGRRVVVGQQDLIAYHNDTYHASVEAWRAYRRTTRLALAGAEQVVFFSDHARRDALAEDLLAGARAHVVGIGADAREPAGPVGEAPDGVSAREPFLLCLGADYAHKNRPFAIELLGALRGLGWEGGLVLCGARVAHGSSRERERELLARDPELARFVTDLGPVGEGGKRWLYANARALVYPTLYEGFGLIPLEAARAGLPCLFAAQASLAEVAPDAATLIPWDASASARAALPLLGEGAARERHLARLRNHRVPSWEELARELVAVYERALSAPPAPAAPRVWQELEREAHIVALDGDIAGLKQTAQEYQDAYHALSARVEHGLALIDRGGLLSTEQQRGLMRVAGRGRLGALALAPLSLLGRGRSGRRAPER